MYDNVFSLYAQRLGEHFRNKLIELNVIEDKILNHDDINKIIESFGGKIILYNPEEIEELYQQGKSSSEDDLEYLKK